ncbi:MAG: cell division protein ZapA [Treponema sp.]|nr:cell division protein ZapA [Treponema sp.]
MGKIQIDMLGARFVVRANEDEAYLNKIYSYYKDITRTIQVNKNLDNPLQISILAGITLVDELLKEKSQNVINRETGMDRDKIQMAEKLANEMISQIDNVL